MCCRALGQLRLEKAPSGLTDVSKLFLNHSSFRDKQQRLQLILLFSTGLLGVCQLQIGASGRDYNDCIRSTGA